MIKFSGRHLLKARALTSTALLFMFLCVPLTGIGQIVDAYFIVNETSNGGRCGQQWAALEANLHDYGYMPAEQRKVAPDKGSLPYRFDVTEGPEDATLKAKRFYDRWLSQRIRTSSDRLLIIAVGGDGTVNEAVQQLAGAEQLVFGILPCGTGNDVSRTLGIPQGDLPAALQVLRYGTSVDYGAYQVRVNTRADERSHYNTPEQKVVWSLDATDVGMGSDAGLRKYRHDTGMERSWLLSFLPRSKTYTASTLMSLARWQPVPLELTIDDQVVSLDGSLNLLIAACGETIGGGIRMTPGMSPQSEQGMAVYAVGEDRFTMLKGLISVVRGQVPDQLITRKFNNIFVKHLPGHDPALVQIDGEPAYQTPLHIKWVPGAFTFRSPVK